MVRINSPRGRGLVNGSVVAILGLALSTALAQDGGTVGTTSGTSTAAPSTAPGSAGLPSNVVSTSAFGSSDSGPYYIGASQALTHDSNVFRTPNGPSDNYSSTSLLGGFDQPISRQRVFGRASVTANRYQDQNQLNNVSYALSTGLAWETINKLSGNLNLRMNRNLAAPASNAAPVARRNIADTKGFDLVARYGGASLLSVEARLGYSRLDYSIPEYVASESQQTSGSIGLYYRPGGPLRLGVAARINRTKTPQALFDPATGSYQPNTIKGRNLDLLADYDLTGLLTANGRLSYTKQTNTNIGESNFSGLTGSVGVNWRPTGKTTVRFDAARDAGFDTDVYSGVVPGDTINPIPSTMTGLYENNRVSYSAGIGASYAATAKISANVGARYLRAKLVSTVVSQGSTVSAPDGADTAKSAYIGANYAISRNWSLACNVSREEREVSGFSDYAYTVNTFACLTQITLR